MSALLDRLQALRRAGVVEAIDVALASWVHARAGDGKADAVALAACLASRAAGDGDVALDLATVAGRAPWPEEAANVVAPELDAWIATLRASLLVAVDPDGGDASGRPLVLRASRLALARFDAYEGRVADGLVARARGEGSGDGVAPVEDTLAALFGKPVPEDEKGQRDAARAAWSSRLTVISGGPGTGKTTTVVKILALLTTHAGTPPKIRLAAPTGKAAARLGEAVCAGREALRSTGAVDPRVLDAMPGEATTVHRMIGTSPVGRPPRFDRDRRLPVDVVVIDEASMLDLALTARVLDALPDGARLILLGDRDQLASVEAGAVLGDVCAAADVPGSPLHGRLAMLTHSWRFREDGGIGKLAAAIRDGRAGEALEAIRAGDDEAGVVEDVDLREPLGAMIVRGYAPFLDARGDGSLDDDGLRGLLDAFDRFRVLCAVKAGPRGVAAVNRLAESALGERLRIPRRSPWYAGRPVLVTRNDRSVRLVNGDVGVTVPVAGEDGAVALRVAFRDADGGVRTVSTARLPEHETCWAMTVHKSQGSEFERVALILPDVGPGGPSPVATRELVYTGVTRARKRVDLFAAEDAFRAAVGRRIERASGLREALARAGS